MFKWLLLAFTVIPLVELFLLIKVGEFVGLPATICIVLVTGILGATLAKAEGFRVLREWQESLARGTVPKEGVVSSALVLVAGVLLVTPGVLTDLFGLSMLLPQVRHVVAEFIKKRFNNAVAAGNVRVISNMDGFQRRYEPDVIDVEGEEIFSSNPELREGSKG